MTAGPRWPGDGPPEYQPARLLLVNGGTAIAPFDASPTRDTGASTSIAGMLIRVGTDRLIGCATGPSGVWCANLRLGSPGAPNSAPRPAPDAKRPARTRSTPIGADRRVRRTIADR